MHEIKTEQCLNANPFSADHGDQGLHNRLITCPQAGSSTKVHESFGIRIFPMLSLHAYSLNCYCMIIADEGILEQLQLDTKSLPPHRSICYIHGNKYSSIWVLVHIPNTLTRSSSPSCYTQGSCGTQKSSPIRMRH